MYEIPEDCGYNKIFKHQWRTRDYGINMSTIERISKLVSGRWGWHFKAHKDMDYSRDNWYENQTCYVSFERKWDLILVKLLIDFNK
tara:strand:- start:158 stop:415 length:258 start_codon:yes stop_codon:yes gene_type:complete